MLKLLLIFILSFTASASDKWAGFITYSPYDLWIPSKIGALVSYQDKNRAYELAYQFSTIRFDFILDEIGSVSDSRLHLTTRSFRYNNSFNYQYGLSYNHFKMNLSPAFSSFDLFEARVLNIVWGVGNRYKWKSGIELGVDWFKIFYPLYTLALNDSALDSVTNSNDKEDLKRVITLLEKIPTFTLVHIELGYRF